MASEHVQLGYLIVIQTFGIISALVYLHHAVRAECREIRRLLRGDQPHD